MTDQFDQEFRDAAEGTEFLTQKLEELDAATNTTGLDRNISTLNDLTYATSGAIGNLETLGYVTWEQSEAFMKAEAAMQLLLVPYELYNIVKTYMIGVETAHVAALQAEIAATTGATAATWSFNAALLANPIVLIVLAVVGLIAVLVALQMKFDILNKILYGIDDLFKAIRNTIGDVIEAFDNLRAKTDILSMVMKSTPIGMAMELYGGTR